MKTLRQVTIKPVFVDELPSLRMQDEIYISRERNVSEHVCLCGCGGTVVMPLNYDLFPATNWKLVEEANGTVSFIGSVGNYQFDCKSHYIITKNVANFV